MSWYLARELLSERRVVAHFRFPGLPRKGGELWVVFDGERSEVCRKDPGFEIELFVEAGPAALAEWHLGRIEWVDALRADRIRVVGDHRLRRLPRNDLGRWIGARRRPALLALLLQVVADYTRLSAVQAAGRAGRGRARGPQYPGVAEDCCRAGVTIRPTGPILTMDRRHTAVLSAVSAAGLTP